MLAKILILIIIIIVILIVVYRERRVIESKEELVKMIKEWAEYDDVAEKKYGNIFNWDVSKISKELIGNKKHKDEYKYTKEDECIITEEERDKIVDWVKRIHKEKLNEIRKNTWMNSLYEIDVEKDIMDIIVKCREKIIEKEDIREYDLMEPVFQDSVGYMIGDSELHEHTDPNFFGLYHTRYNLYVQLPEEGGYPIYAGRTHRLKERSYICCRAGIDKHRCEDVKGSKPRVMISFGFLLPYERIKNITYDYNLDNGEVV
jgi:hypothetical protein